MSAQRDKTAAASRVTPEAAWQAVLTRDPRFDGRLVYAVSTTGVYCRPVCASRRPRRQHVSFFTSPAGAEAAGYRECKRCRPRNPGPSAAVRGVERARAFLDAHLDETVTLERLGKVAHASPFHLQRTFKLVLGVTPREYVRTRRAERLKGHLRNGASVSRATYEAGYSSSSRLYERADQDLGMTPASYRRRGEGMTIRYSTTSSPAGRLLVAATDRGVCAVALGDDDVKLEQELAREYSRARLERAAGDLRSLVDAVVAGLGGAPRESAGLPLDVQATAFQWRVWRALRDIPRGSTRSYREIARAIGKPTATRAVARACASNRVALLIPCHRVVREDGALGGYRWGVERKRKLLAAEQAG